MRSLKIGREAKGSGGGAKRSDGGDPKDRVVGAKGSGGGELKDRVGEPKDRVVGS